MVFRETALCWQAPRPADMAFPSGITGDASPLALPPLPDNCALFGGGMIDLIAHERGVSMKDKVIEKQTGTEQNAQAESELEQEMEPGVEVKQAFLPNLAALKCARVPSPTRGIGE